MKKFFISAFALATLSLSSQTTQFYAPTLTGGAHGGGAIYSVDGAGNNYQKRYDFSYNTAVSGFCEGANGKLYGAGGAASTFVDGTGTIFEYDVINNVMYEKYTFPGGMGAPVPGPMTLAPNNKMYGTSSAGGTYGQGFIFEYDYVNNIATIKYHFDGVANGGQPATQLLLASNGKMYGATHAGSVLNEGSMFEYDYINDVFTKKMDFASGPGAQPGVFMAQGTNQLIYGCLGGTTSLPGGGVFAYDIANDTMGIVHYFNTTSSGGMPGVIHAHGKIYGTTYAAGSNSNGNLFEYDYNTSSYTSLWNFDITSGNYPASPPLCINNKLYVFNQTGGSGTYGSMVSYNLTTSAQTVLHYFGTPGVLQPGGSIIYTNGKIYGRGTYGGISYFGEFFSADTLGTVTSLLGMAYSSTGNYPNDLAYIYGNLYATTYMGGTYNAGIIYKFDPALQQFTQLWEFDKFSNGYNPKGAFIPSSGTSVYGVTEAGGANDYGQLYEFDLNTLAYTPIFDMNDPTIGSYPTGYIVKHGNGKIYGTNQEGGVSGKGTIFEVDPIAFTGVKRYDFSNPNNGWRPAGITLGANGKIYGVASEQGATSNGTFFEFTPPATFTKKFDFNATTKGDHPVGRPLEVSPGIFYGLTSGGGTNGKGVLYKYKVSSNTFTKLVDFDSLDVNKGCRPNCSLTMGAGGKIYGTTLWGGTNNLGIMFEYDTLTATLTKKLDFNGSNGRGPGSLTLVCGTTTYDAGNNASFCNGSQHVLGTTPDVGYSYSWSPTTGLTGATSANPTLTVQNSPVTYTVTESYLGCVSSDNITVSPLLVQTPDICLVTDDSADVYNHVVWEKSLYNGVDSFIVYREVATSSYIRIGAVSNDSLSVFIDTTRSVGPANGDPRLSTYHYKISIKDTCGNEGAMSPWHTSIYFNDLHNGSFTWNTYAVETMSVTPISTYELLRDSNNTGYWKVIASCAGTSNILVDPQYSTFQNIANWRVQANGISCSPSMRYANNNNVQTTIVRSKSNISNNRTMGVKSLNDKGIALYPNPFSDRFTITGEEKAAITVYNALGEIVYAGQITDNKLTIDLATHAAGVYNVTIKTEKGLTVKKIVKQ